MPHEKDAFEAKNPYRAEGRVVWGPGIHGKDMAMDLLPDDMAARLQAHAMNEAFRLGYRAALMEKA